MARFLVYGEQDLNLVDGSSVWQASIIEVLASVDGAQVDVLTRTQLRRTILLEEVVDCANVRFLDPFQARFPLKELRRPQHVRMDEVEAATRITALDALADYDFVLLRSIPVAKQLLRTSPDTLAKSWVYVTRDALLSADAIAARNLVSGCCRVLCQTPEVESAVRALVGESIGCFGLLPPMVRTPGVTAMPKESSKALRVAYSGKFSAGYFLEETIDALVKARSRGVSIEFDVFGDKFHAPSDDPDFESRLRARFGSERWIRWHGAKPRAEVYAALADCDVGISWRGAQFDDSPELSTKVLEYASLGLPVLMNPNPVQLRVFGADYPCFVRSGEDVCAVLSRLASDRSFAASSGARCRDIATEYGFDRTRDRVQSYFEKDVRRVGGRSVDRLRVLVAGHDLKFMREIYSYFRDRKGARIDVDAWAGHTDPDTEQRRLLAEQAQVIWCEWLLGNAVYYARRKRPDQYLIVRLHHQEMDLPFRRQIRWSAVDALLITCHQHYDRLRKELPDVRDRIHFVPQLITCDHFDRPKFDGAPFTLGFLGIAPFRKRPDLALQILEGLRRSDSRFNLSIKSRHPWEYGWLWERKEEREAFASFYARVQEIPGVHFDPHGSDVAEWFQRVGYIVSTSDHEGSHQAVAEGMASGAVPILRNWDGADRLYPERLVFQEPDQAVERVLANQHRFVEESAASKDYARANFDAPQVFQRMDAVFGARVGG